MGVQIQIGSKMKKKIGWIEPIIVENDKDVSLFKY